MNACWNYVLGGGGRARNPQGKLHFTGNDLDGYGEALVREGIQNALDAAIDGPQVDKEVRIVLKLIRNPSKSALERLSQLRIQGKPHFDRGLPRTYLDALKCEKVAFLTFEDFGTKGLVGDTSECGFESSPENAFHGFFRSEGQGGKADGSLGRFGIGKDVWSSSSNMKSHFGYSIRRGTPARVLMGSASLNSRTVDGNDYAQDVWFGIGGENVMPITEEGYLKEFCQDFQLERKDQTGLSIVVPFVSERIIKEDLIDAVAKNFYWLILRGELQVRIDEDSSVTELTAETLISHMKPSSDEKKLVELADWACQLKPKDHIVLPIELGPKYKPDWKHNSTGVRDEQAEIIKKELQQTSRVGIKIPVKVREKINKKRESNSHFCVYLEKTESTGYRPNFVRGGMLIGKMRRGRINGFRSIVSIDPTTQKTDDVTQEIDLSTLLGDSEGVAHTEWSVNTDLFRGKYIYGPETISYVRNSVSAVIRAIAGAENKGNPDLLLEVFNIPGKDGSPKPRNKPQKTARGEESEPKPKDIPSPDGKIYDIYQIDGGFGIRQANAFLTKLPRTIKLMMGYARRDGRDPFDAWTKDDFNLPIGFKRNNPKGIKIRKESGNLYELEIVNREFQLEVKGFDKNRDLEISARLQPDKNQDETTI
ncbi:MAG: hypothetical protein ACN6I3_00435 [bacterium]